MARYLFRIAVCTILIMIHGAARSQNLAQLPGATMKTTTPKDPFKFARHVDEETLFATISKRSHERFLTQTKAGVEALRAQGIGGAGISRLIRPYVITRIRPREHALLFTLAGRACVRAGEAKLIFAPGTVALLPAGLDHSYDAEKPLHLLWYHLENVTPWAELTPATPLVVRAIWTQALLDYSTAFWEETARPEAIGHAAVLNDLARLLARFLQRELQQVKAPLVSERQLRLETLWREVLAHPEKNWTVDFLAKSAGLSGSHLQALMGEIYGRGAMDMVTKLRMERAADLLISRPSYKLADIAGMVGYENAFSFSRTFKRTLGHSPQHHRQACLE